MATLVTGASGFVGSAVARALLARGCHVRTIARPGSDHRNLDGLDIEVVSGDVTDAGTRRLALGGARAVFHVAADYRLWVPDPVNMYKTNIDASIALIREAAEAGATRIVYTSSVATLGLPDDGGVGDEGTPVAFDDMIGHYKRSKFLAEEAILKLAKHDGLPIVVVNPSTPVGPRDIKPTPTGKLIRDAAAGRVPAYVDTGLNVVHVDDVAVGHLLAHDMGVIGERYVLGGTDIALRDLLGIIANYVGRRPARLKLPTFAALPVAYAAEAWAHLTGREPLATVDGVRLARKYMYFSSDKARVLLGYSSRPIATAISEAIEWFSGNGYLPR